MNKYFDNFVERKLLNIRTADLATVLSVSGKTARLQPLTMRKAVGGQPEKQTTITAIVPPFVKVKEERIICDSIDIKVLVKDDLKPGDLVCVGFCDRDITHAKSGAIREATNRHHNSNDAVILRVL